MNLGEYLLGVAWLAAIATVLLFAAIRARHWLCPEWSGPPAWLVDAVLALSMLLVTSELIGLFGWFTRAGVLLAVVALGGVVAIATPPVTPARPSPPAPGFGGWLFGLAIVASLATALLWAEAVVQSLEVGIYRQDSTWYHLTFSARFFQTAHTGGLAFTDPLHLSAWFYPQNSELLHAVGMVAFRDDFLSPLLNFGWMMLLLLAAWCVGRPFGRGSLALLACSVLLASNMMQVQAGNAPNDAPALAFLLAAIAILTNALVPDSPRSVSSLSPGRLLPDIGRGPLFAAALAAGLAVGTKMTLLPTVGALTVAAALLAPRGARLGSTGIWLGGVGLTGGFWYVRNLIQAGNPLPWIGFGVLPTPNQLALYPRLPHSVADYLGRPGIWHGWFAPGLHDSFGPLWPLLLAGIAAGVLLAFLSRQHLFVRVLGAVGVVTILAYLFIPVGASGPDGSPYGFVSNLRYLAPGMLIGLMALVLAIPSRGAAVKWVTAGAALMCLSVVISSDSWGLGELPASLLLVACLVALPLGLAYAARARPSGLTIGVGVTAAFVLMVALGYPEQRTYARQRYLAALAPALDNPGFRSAPQWEPVQDWARRQRGARIGVVGPAGAFGQYIFYGGDLSNRVQYIGEPGAHGTLRPIDNCYQWRWAVDAGHYDYVVITPPLALGLGVSPPEEVWTRGDPAAVEVLGADPAVVFRIRGTLDPKGCASQLPNSALGRPWSGAGAPGGATGAPISPTGPPQQPPIGTSQPPTGAPQPPTGAPLVPGQPGG